MNKYIYLSLGDMLIAHAKSLSVETDPRRDMPSRLAARKARQIEVKLRSSAHKAERDIEPVKVHIDERERDIAAQAEIMSTLSDARQSASAAENLPAKFHLVEIIRQPKSPT